MKLGVFILAIIYNISLSISSHKLNMIWFQRALVGYVFREFFYLIDFEKFRITKSRKTTVLFYPWINFAADWRLQIIFGGFVKAHFHRYVKAVLALKW